MNPAQQIAKLKGHVLIFSNELRSLIQSFELLFLAAENQELHQKISGTKQARGFSVNRWSLIQECIIGITKLAYDQGSQNPTAGNLIEIILNPQAVGLREKLKTRFAVPIRSGLVPGRPPTKDDLALDEAIEKKDIEDLNQAFEQHLLDLAKEWQWFDKHQDKFKKLRDRRLAHVDVAKAGETYELKGASGPEWKVVKEAVQRLIRITELLLTILHNKDEGFDQFVELARRDARDYWQITSAG
jgi:AbiU2